MSRLRCCLRLPKIFLDHVTNEAVRSRIQDAFRVHDDLVTMAKTQKRRGYGHLSTSSGMAKTILQGTVKGTTRGRQKKRWKDNIKMDRNVVWRIPEGTKRQRKVERYCCNVSFVPCRQTRLRDWDEMRCDVYTLLSLQIFRKNEAFKVYYLFCDLFFFQYSDSGILYRSGSFLRKYGGRAEMGILAILKMG